MELCWALVTVLLLHPEFSSCSLSDSSLYALVPDWKALTLIPFVTSQPQEALLSCVGGNNEAGTCVPMESCILPELKEDYVKNKQYFCIRDHHLFREVGVCCPLGRDLFEVSSSNLDTASAEPPSVVNINSVDTVVENEISESSPDTFAKLGESFLCGYNGKKITRVQGGQEADKKDWPWMAVLLRRDDFFHYCGGVLITRRHVLTAAHCVHRSKAEDILVRLGEYDFEKINETRITDMRVREIRFHEDFDVATYENDIAVLVLTELALYGVYVQPLCLPTPGPDYTNITAIVAGWGTLSYGGPMSEVLMEVAIPVWEQDTCVSSFTQTIFNSSLCAGAFEGGKDSCQGDSGGPLMVQRSDNRWQTIGVVSWGVRCGERGKPGIYTRVNRYLDWLAPRIQDV